MRNREERGKERIRQIEGKRERKKEERRGERERERERGRGRGEGERETRDRGEKHTDADSSVIFYGTTAIVDRSSGKYRLSVVRRLVTRGDGKGVPCSPSYPDVCFESE